MAQSTSLYQDHVLQAILQGNLASVPNPPSRILKIVLSSSNSDFEHERRVLHERVLPGLQRHCAASGGARRVDVAVVDLQRPVTAAGLHLAEIEDCHASSLACFLVCLIGNKRKPFALPPTVDASEFLSIRSCCQDAGLDTATLDRWYTLNDAISPAIYELEPSYGYPPPDCTSTDDGQLAGTLEYGVRAALRGGLLPQERARELLQTSVQSHLRHALTLSKDAAQRILCVVRQFDDFNDIRSAAASQFFDVDDAFDSVAAAATASDAPDDAAAAAAAAAVTASADAISEAIVNLDINNCFFFNVSWQPSGINPKSADHGAYLENFAAVLLARLKDMVDREIQAESPDWDELPPTFRKVVREVVREAQTHLCNSRDLVRGVLDAPADVHSDLLPPPLLATIQRLMCGDDDDDNHHHHPHDGPHSHHHHHRRHTPLVVVGAQGSGKSTLLAQVLTYCPDWLGNDVVRIIRSVAHSPCSSYTAELLRNLCLHISMVFGFEISPKHHSFELGKLSVWFQDLLKQVETTTNDLVIILDDLDELKCPPSSQGSLLGWLPRTLPLNVHIVCSVSSESSSIISLLKSRISSPDSYVHISELHMKAAASQLASRLRQDDASQSPADAQLPPHDAERVAPDVDAVPDSPMLARLLAERQLRRRRRRRSQRCHRHRNSQLQNGSQASQAVDGAIVAVAAAAGGDGKRFTLDVSGVVDEALTALEMRYGVNPVRRICSFLACSTFGFREPELMELLLTTDSELQRPLLGWPAIKDALGSLLRKTYVDCRLYVQWSHRCISQYVRDRYLPTEADLRGCHAELGSAFHSGFVAQVETKAAALGIAYDESAATAKPNDDWSEILREIDEAWFHLLHGGEILRLKRAAVCNFEFLQCAVRAASVGYVRSVLEMVRSMVLDWEIEIIYNMTRQAVDVLSQDPQQLATEILNWLSPYAADASSKLLEDLVEQANTWCGRVRTPLLVPQANWLSLSLPPQAHSFQLPSPAALVVVSPDSQLLYAVLTEADSRVTAFHVATRRQLFDIIGHRATVTCLCLTESGRWLITGSEDTTLIVFDALRGSLVRRMNHHVASIECVALSQSARTAGGTGDNLSGNEDRLLVFSGSSIGVVVVSRLDSGQLVQRLENHRGSISAIAVNAGNDVFVTASSDRTVCIWSIEDFSLLNTITLQSPIVTLKISYDSTFLLITCDDNTIHVRSLTTGSDVHRLKG